jgi:nucleoside-diphosphate-sugar epimerase
VRVFCIGGTGFPGTHLVSRLTERNHEVTILAGSEAEACRASSLGLAAVVGDLLTPELYMSRQRSHDVVVHLARPCVPLGRVSSRQFRILRWQAETHARSGIYIAERFDCPLILASDIASHSSWDEIANGAGPLRRSGVGRIAEGTEPLIADVLRRGSPPLVRVISGEIYGPGGAFAATTYGRLREGKYRIVGAGDNHIPRIHVDDWAEAVTRILDRIPLGEDFIISDDGACTEREFGDLVADLMNVPRPGSIPGVITRFTMGRLAYEARTLDCISSNAKAKAELDWELKYPTCREGISATIREIEHPMGALLEEQEDRLPDGTPPYLEKVDVR